MLQVEIVDGGDRAKTLGHACRSATSAMGRLRRAVRVRMARPDGLVEQRQAFRAEPEPDALAGAARRCRPGAAP